MAEVKFNIQRASATEITKYIERQAAFFEDINKKCIAAGRSPQFLDPQQAARIYDIIPVDKGGYKLAKRDKPLMAIDDDLDGHAALVASMSKTLGEKTGAAKMRGKYNDGALLMDQCADYTIGEALEFVQGRN